MEQINNDQTIKEVSAVLGHQIENIPMLDTSKVILVSDINPKNIKRIDTIKTANYITTGTTRLIFTTETSRTFFLTGIQLNVIKDATCDMADIQCYMSGVIDGLVMKLTTIETLTLTAQNQNNIIMFNQPIKLDKNSSVSVTHGSFTVGKFRITAIAYGYYTDNSN